MATENTFVDELFELFAAGVVMALFCDKLVDCENPNPNPNLECLLDPFFESYQEKLRKEPQKLCLETKTFLSFQAFYELKLQERCLGTEAIFQFPTMNMYVILHLYGIYIAFIWHFYCNHIDCYWPRIPRQRCLFAL